MKAAVIVFPGSNCDRDIFTVLRSAWGLAPKPKDQSAKSYLEDHDVQLVWHQDASLPEVDLVAVPGGFSYGDYLRCGAMAAHSPVMAEVKKHAEKGRLVLGICNGFQVLTEAGLLPGALMQNAGLKFVCKETRLRVERNDTAFTTAYGKNQVVTIPVAHHEGNYFVDQDTLKSIEDSGQVAFRYCDSKGELTADANPNGSMGNIAGVYNKARNVLGMMPHPERHADAAVGSVDGLPMFESLLKAA